MTAHIAIVTDAGYLPWCATAVQSIVESDTEADLVVHVLHDGTIDDAAAARLASMGTTSVTIVVLSVPGDAFEGLPDLGRFGRTVWIRCMLADLFPEVDRMLYLDADVLVTGALDDLLETDLGERPIGAVGDVMPRRHWDRVQTLGMVSPGHYFNSGVLVMDLAAMRADPVIPRVADIVAVFGDAIHYPDQDVLNLIFAGRWAALHPRANTQNRLVMWADFGDAVFGVQTRAEALAAPTVVHFEGPDAWKPWHAAAIHPRRTQYRSVLRRTPWAQIPLIDDSLIVRAIQHLPEGRRWAAFYLYRDLRRSLRSEFARRVRARLGPGRPGRCESTPAEQRPLASGLHPDRSADHPLAIVAPGVRNLVARCLPFVAPGRASHHQIDVLVAIHSRVDRHVSTFPDRPIAIHGSSEGGEALAVLLTAEIAGGTPQIIIVDPDLTPARQARIERLLATADTKTSIHFERRPDASPPDALVVTAGDGGASAR